MPHLARSLMATHTRSNKPRCRARIVLGDWLRVGTDHNVIEQPERQNPPDSTIVRIMYIMLN